MSDVKGPPARKAHKSGADYLREKLAQETEKRKKVEREAEACRNQSVVLRNENASLKRQKAEQRFRVTVMRCAWSQMTHAEAAEKGKELINVGLTGWFTITEET